MKALIATLAAAGALGIALPAAAQPFGLGAGVGVGGGLALGAGSNLIERRIDQGVRSGALTLQEARRLSRDAANLRQLEHRYGRDGVITPREARELDRRYAQLDMRLQVALRNGPYRFGRGYGPGWNPSYR